MRLFAGVWLFLGYYVTWSLLNHTAAEKMFKIFALVALPALISAQVPACPNPTFDCLAGNAQFTVLGNITEVNKSPPYNQTSFVANMDIKCAYSSFSRPSSRLISAKTFPVRNFGYPQ